MGLALLRHYAFLFPVVQSLKVIYSEDPAALQAIADLLLLQEQARSMVCHVTLAEPFGALMPLACACRASWR